MNILVHKNRATSRRSGQDYYFQRRDVPKAKIFNVATSPGLPSENF